MHLNKLLINGRLGSLMFLAALAALGWAAGAEAQARALGNRGPINIAADRLEADDLEQVVVFTGNVVARQGDLTLSCDLMQVAYSSQAGAGQVSEEGRPAADPLNAGGQSIDRIDCLGAVQISQNDQVAVGDKAVYLARNTPRRIVLTGNARLWQGRDYLTGHQVTYYLDQGRSVVEGEDGQRVRGSYYQGREQKPPKREDTAGEGRP